MATAVINYPKGQHAKEGEKVELKIKYTGDQPNPDDMHLYVKPTGDSHYRDRPDAGWDIDPAKARDPGVILNWPVGESGSYDFQVVWTWKKPGAPPQTTKGGDGQYYSDKRRRFIDEGWCLMLIAIAAAIGGWVGAVGFLSWIGYLIGIAAGFGIGVLLCVLLHWAMDSR